MEDIFRLSRRIKFASLVRKLFVIFLVSTLVLLLSAIQSITQIPNQSFGQQPCDPTIQSCPEPPPVSGCDPTTQTCVEPPPPPVTGCDPTISTCVEPPPPPVTGCNPTITTCVPEPPIPDLRVHPDPNPPSQYPPKEAFASSKYECDPKSEQLQVGSKGEKVIELQTYLNDLGYAAALAPEGIDGKFGPHTKNSVMQYQNERMGGKYAPPGDKRVDGIVGPNTWESLCIDAYLWFQDESYYFKHFPPP